MLAAGDDKKAEFIATVTPMDLDAAKHAVANGAPAAENNEPVEWSRASARRCIAKLVANGDINTENDIKAEFIANGAPAAEKQEKTDDDAAPGKKIDQIVIDESDDDAEQPKDPKAFIHNKPEEIEIYRQLKPVFSAAEQKVLLFQHTGKTVCDYIEGVRESWSKYVGDVMHFQLGEEDCASSCTLRRSTTARRALSSLSSLRIRISIVCSPSRGKRLPTCVSPILPKSTYTKRAPSSIWHTIRAV